MRRCSILARFLARCVFVMPVFQALGGVRLGSNERTAAAISLGMGCRISAAPAVLWVVRPSRGRARFLNDHVYDHDQNQTIDSERDTVFAVLANSRPRCAQALRRHGSPCLAVCGAGGKPEDENQLALEGKDQAVRSAGSAHRVGVARRLAAQALTFGGETGAVATCSRVLATLGVRGRAREPGQRRMSARTSRTGRGVAEYSAMGPSCRMNTRTVGLHCGERPRSGFTPPDRVPRLLHPGFGHQGLRKIQVGPGTFPRIGRVAVFGPPRLDVACGGSAVLLHVTGCCAWYRIRRTRLHYALHSPSKRTDLVAERTARPGGDRGGGPPGTAGVLGHKSGRGPGCVQVAGHHGVRVRALARSERRAVPGREHGCLAAGCTGKPLAAFASPASPRVRLTRAGSRSDHSPRRKGTAGTALGRRVFALGHMMAASRCPAGAFPTYPWRSGNREMLERRKPS
jgi:hypothetical protein